MPLLFTPRLTNYIIMVKNVGKGGYFMLSPINRQKVSSQIFIELQKYFNQSQLEPGDRLPSERELAGLLNVSRNSLREAFRVLEILGLIEIIPGSGTYVKKISDDTILPLAIALSVENNSIVELMEVRQILESSGASIAAQRRDQQDIQQLKTTLNEMENSVNNLKNWVQADIRFHYLIAKSTKNSLLLRLYRTIADSLAESIEIAVKKRFESTKNPLDTFREHFEIYEAIVNQNSDLAQHAMCSHLIGATEEVEKAINHYVKP